MAIPRVFVSSTCYDLKYIRENIKYFIRTVGYEPVLSEDGAVFYNPTQHTHDSCISEVPNCQILVLIIGGRYGGEFKDNATSITNEEYREAKKSKIPVFALVEQSVYSDHYVFNKNKGNKQIDYTKIDYPSADDIRIFEFIDEVRSAAVNNAIVPFKDFSDIEAYLKQQWAGMMFSFLMAKNQESRVTDMMSELIAMNERIEYMSAQLVKSVGSPETLVLVQLYEKLMGSRSMKALSDIGLQPNPIAVLMHDTLADCARHLGKEFKVGDFDFSISSHGEIDRDHFKFVSGDYKVIRDQLLSIVKSHNLTVDSLIAYQQNQPKKRPPVAKRTRTGAPVAEPTGRN